MSHRPWESPSRHTRPPLPPPPQISLSYSYSHSRPPPPPPPPQHQQLLPPISNSQNPFDPSFPPIKRRRSSAEVRPPLTTSAPSLPSIRTPANPYQSLSRFPTASSLSPFVAQLHDIVRRLTATPGSPPASATPPTSPSEFTTLEKIGAGLESICQQLYGRALPPANSPTEAQAQLASLTIAHEKLKHEHNDLKRQLDRSKIRAETLSKKMEALEKESEEDKIENERLRGVVEQLEESVEDLRSERDEARRDLNSQGAQWGVIVQNAGRIENGLWGQVKRLRNMQSSEQVKDDVGSPRSGCGNACMGQEKLRRRVEYLEQALERCRMSGIEVQHLAAKLAGVGSEMANVGNVGRNHGNDIAPLGLGIGVG